MFDKNKLARKNNPNILASQIYNTSNVSSRDLFNNKQTRKSTNDEVGSEPSINIIPMNLNFKMAYKEYSFTVILKNIQKTDVRVYKVTVSVHPRIINAQLELRVPLGEEIKQEIPIVNNTDKDWNFKITWNLGHDPVNTYFTGPKEFLVRKRTTNYYPLIFRPLSICKSEGKITLTNSYTNDVFNYELIGFGDEPLAKDHIVLDCIAKIPTNKTIELINPYKDKPITYIVETDLMNPDGPPKFTIPAGKSYRYPLSVVPALGGLYTGSITFFEEGDKNRYVWYTIAMRTDRPSSEKTIELSTIVRKSISLDIELYNPLKESITFEVSIEGQGLHGSPTFKLLPHQTATYALLFLPLQTFRGKGSIAFIEEKLGEIWYDLNLISEECPVIRSHTLKAELGKVAEWQVFLENPSNEDCEIGYKISNPNNFDIFPDIVTIPRYEATKVNIR